ncbi:hypothetical protein HPP92_018264 [Vanilla planifolia]|uniref:Uncharacterized protein n=1 Tax=Vanilla planifolia TaxID=51239 RepID=A0A835Q6R0_VANPL|nr:hypothetical protein HPP92_018264 [Vanilla planifolia]
MNSRQNEIDHTNLERVHGEGAQELHASEEASAIIAHRDPSIRQNEPKITKKERRFQGFSKVEQEMVKKLITEQIPEALLPLLLAIYMVRYVQISEQEIERN